MSIRFSRWLVATLLTGLLGLLAAGFAAAPWRSGTPGAASLDDLWRDHLHRTGAPGGAYAVVTAEGTTHRGAAGVDGSGDPYSAETRGLWGSLAKPVAASVATDLAARGALDLDATLDRYLQPPCSAGAFNDVTVRELIHHTAGVGSPPDALDVARPGPARDAAADLCADATGSPGGYRYSSGGYRLVADLGARTGAHTLVATSAAARTMPPGHRLVFGRPTAMTTPYDGAGAGYGYLGGSLRDLEAVARGSLGADPPLGSPTRDAGVATPSGERYGAGWRLRSLADGTTFAWHSGMAPGYSATLMVWPERGLALVTMTNLSGPWHAEPLLAGPMELAARVAPTDPANGSAAGSGSGASAGASHGPSRSVDALYPALVGTLTAALILLGATVARPPRRLGIVLLALGVAGLAGVVWAVANGWARQAWLWAPDVTALAVAAIALSLVAGARATTRRRPSGEQTSRRRPSAEKAPVDGRGDPPQTGSAWGSFDATRSVMRRA